MLCPSYLFSFFSLLVKDCLLNLVVEVFIHHLVVKMQFLLWYLGIHCHYILIIPRKVFNQLCLWLFSRWLGFQLTDSLHHHWYLFDNQFVRLFLTYRNLYFQFLAVYPTQIIPPFLLLPRLLAHLLYYSFQNQSLHRWVHFLLLEFNQSSGLKSAFGPLWYK